MPFLLLPLRLELPMEHQSSSPSPSHGPPSISTLARFGSAPGSFLSTLVDSTTGEFSTVHPTSTPPARMTSRFFAGGGGDSPCLTSESTCKNSDLHIGLHRPHGHVGSNAAAAHPAVNDGDGSRGGGGGGSSALFRHSSSPAGFLSHLTMDNTGFSNGRGGEQYSQMGNLEGVHGVGNRRVKSQLSFSSRQDSLSHISHMSIPEEREGHRSNDANTHLYITSGFQLSSWDETNSIVFSAHSAKRGRGNNGADITAALSTLDSHVMTALDMENVENLFQIQQDSTVPCKMRAKRGCATHPRSIAERERRTRISEKLKRLQELVPNMDKQTSTADMLDLAVQHIKILRGQVQRLNQECEGCTCGSKHDVS